MSQYAVIGLGTFGRTVALELMRLGHEVLGVDIRKASVELMADELTHAIIADATQESALRELDIDHYDQVIVAIGENLEASLLCTLHLKDLGVKDVWVKAITSDHHRILAKLGASRIIHPEHEMGLRVAQALNYPMVRDYLALGDDTFVVEVEASKRLQDHTPGELLDNAQAGVEFLAIKRGQMLTTRPEPGYKLREGDRLVLSGRLEELRKLADSL